jgi:iron complex outermembrane receptor protein
MRTRVRLAFFRVLTLAAIVAGTLTARPAASEEATATAAPENSADTGVLQEVIVTAERRQTKLQETPIAAAVLSGAQLQNEQINNILDLAAALPSTVIGVAVGQARLAVRGIGYTDLHAGGEGRVGFYIDDIYVSAPAAQLGAFFDVDQVEALRGPQGALFGRNTTGGAFVVTTRQPTSETSGYIDATIGNYSLLKTEGAFSGALTDTLNGRVAFSELSRNGYGTNIPTETPVNNAHQQSYRGSISWQPSDQVKVTAEAHYHVESDQNYTTLQFGQAFPLAVGTCTQCTKIPLPTPGSPEWITNSQNTSSYFPPSQQRHSDGASSVVSYQINDSLAFRTILGYLQSYYDWIEIANGIDIQMNYTNASSKEFQYSGEMQLVGNMEKLHWIVGLYDFHENNEVQSLTVANAAMYVFGAAPMMTQGIQSGGLLLTDSYAIFGQATYDLTGRLSLTVGGRYLDEPKKLENNFQGLNFVTPWPAPGVPGGIILNANTLKLPYNQSLDANKFNPKATIDFKISPDIYTYFTYAQGFKSGGFNWGQNAPAYAPETLTDYEGGLKATLLNRRLIANLSAFYYNYSNIQEQVAGGNFIGITTQSAGKADVKGVELEFAATPTSALEFDGSASFLHAVFVGGLLTQDPNRPTLGLINLNGNWIPGAPRYTVNFGTNYTWQLPGGHLTGRAEYRRTGTTDWSIFNLDTEKQYNYGVGNAFLTYYREGGHWTASAYLRNIGNTFAAATKWQQSNATGAGVSGDVIDPRTYGVTLGYKF